jgi:hypothetical protein
MSFCQFPGSVRLTEVLAIHRREDLQLSSDTEQGLVLQLVDAFEHLLLFPYQ